MAFSRNLQIQILREFEDAAREDRNRRFSTVAQYEAIVGRSRPQAFEWRTCRLCEMVFAVLLPWPGKPREYCCDRHALLARVRRHRAA